MIEKVLTQPIDIEKAYGEWEEEIYMKTAMRTVHTLLVMMRYYDWTRACTVWYKLYNNTGKRL